MRLVIFAAAVFAAALPPAARAADVQKPTGDRSQTVRYLAGLQQPDGGFLPAAGAPSTGKAQGSLRATSGAARALKYFGGDLPDRAVAAAFVKSCFDEKTGGFADRPGGKPDVGLTAVGLMAVAALKLPTESYAPRAVQYLAENAKSFEEIRIAVAGMEAVNSFPEIVKTWHHDVLKQGNGDGTWGKDDRARATGGAVALLLRSGGQLGDTERRKALEAMRAGQHEDGGFGKAEAGPSDLESSYRIMRAFHLLGEQPRDVAALKGFLAKCQNADGGYGVAPGQSSSVGGTYYAGSILHWLERQR